jgi:pyridoxal phosphate enzyme (YggS family)
MIDLETNLETVRERIASATKRVGRDPSEVLLVAVTKTQPPEVIQAVYELGVRDFGENRVGEAQAKVDHLPEDVTWHMIGHIQSRKAAQAVSLFQIVHSVDRVKIARRLDRFCEDRIEPLPILIECNVSGEQSKYGFDADQWAERNEHQWEALLAAVKEIMALPNLQVQGLMTMAPIVTHAEETRPVFARLRQLRDRLATVLPQADWPHLSMGMTDDFEVAIEEGATLVRVGRAIFDPELPPWRKC